MLEGRQTIAALINGYSVKATLGSIIGRLTPAGKRAARHDNGFRAERARIVINCPVPIPASFQVLKPLIRYCPRAAVMSKNQDFSALTVITQKPDINHMLALSREKIPC